MLNMIKGVFRTNFFLYLGSIFLFLTIYLASSSFYFLSFLFFLGGFLFNYLILISVKSREDLDRFRGGKRLGLLGFDFFNFYMLICFIVFLLPLIFGFGGTSFFFLFFILFFWVKTSKRFYFNFFWFFFGYEYYKVFSSVNCYVFISKKKDVKNIDVFNDSDLVRLNNFTFLEI